MSPCSAYAVALDAEKIITRPIPTSVATTEKSTVSGGAATYERTGTRSRVSSLVLRLRAFGAPLRMAALLLRTGGLPQRFDRRGKALAAIFGRLKHVKRRTARREQHDVTRFGNVPRFTH